MMPMMFLQPFPAPSLCSANAKQSASFAAITLHLNFFLRYLASPNLLNASIFEEPAIEPSLVMTSGMLIPIPAIFFPSLRCEIILHINPRTSFFVIRTIDADIFFLKYTFFSFIFLNLLLNSTPSILVPPISKAIAYSIFFKRLFYLNLIQFHFFPLLWLSPVFFLLLLQLL